MLCVITIASRRSFVCFVRSRVWYRESGFQNFASAAVRPSDHKASPAVIRATLVFGYSGGVRLRDVFSQK